MIAVNVSDYYGNSVAMPNIQCHLSWETLEIYHLVALHIAVTLCVFQAFRFRQSLPLQILIADCCRIPFPSFKTYVIALRIRFSRICWIKSLQIRSMTLLAVFRHSPYVDHSDCGSNNAVFILIQSFYLAVQS